ncbi:replication-relaxation family protein [Candidatus Saccharibacteria bacterium]|nr:replication-relaxation family protein [Candidatus Saccharibacteria bacterium]
MKLQTIPKITHKQTEILDLIYTHRFLNRIQIQAFLKHKDKKTINLWLKDLRQKDYINWIYNKHHFAEKTKPAIYYSRYQWDKALT